MGDDLFAVYEDFRDRGVSWSPTHGGFWVVSRYADARAVLSDHETYSSASGVLLPARGSRALVLEQDPPEHTALRKLLVVGVGRAAVARRSAELREMIERVVGAFVGTGGGDARRLISERVPVEAIALVLGLSAESAARVRELTTQAWKQVASVGPAAFAPMSEMLHAEMVSRRAGPRDDFLTTLADAEVTGHPLTDAERTTFLIGCVVAGHETTMNSATNLMHELSLDPALQQRLREHEDRIPAAIEECLRHRAPIHVFFRTATKATTLVGANISPGEKVCVMLASGNRDASVFADPDRFVPDRHDHPHLSFGWGIHRCVGSYLAQTELRMLTETLLRAGTLAADGRPEPAPLEGGHHMGFASLPLRVVRTPTG